MDHDKIIRVNSKPVAKILKLPIDTDLFHGMQVPAYSEADISLSWFWSA
jgi:hypothetical protein